MPRQYQRKPSIPKYEDKGYTPSFAGRPPKDDGSGNIDITIDVKAMSKLPHSSYAVQVDPYTEVNNPATPYHLINRFNKVLGGKYAGQANLDGGNLIQYNSAVNSKFLEVFDSALMSIGLNYRYLPVLASDTTRGKDMVDEMIKAIAEVVSSLNATTFKDQNIFYYGVETSLPMGSHTPSTVTIGGTSHNVYLNIEEVIYAMAMEYQLILQDVIFVFNMFNANRSRMGTMIRMSWNREVPILNSYFGLLKKKSFLSMFDSVALNVQGEYVDTDWMRQVNTFNMIASRRSNSISDPILEIIAHHNRPGTFKTWIATDSAKTTWISTPIFDYSAMKYTPAGAQSAITFDNAIKKLSLRLSIEDTLDWARNVTTGNVTENDRFNEIKDNLDVVTYCLGLFKGAFTDLRTVLTIMARIGVVNWQLGTRLIVTKDTDCEIANYLVVDNIYQEVFGGAKDIVYNDTTKRWRTYSLWNLYYGTPEYAEKSGGAFFSFSVKDLSYTGSPSNLGYLPIAFYLGSFVGQAGSYCIILNRSGKKFYVSRASGGVTMHGNKVFTRLVPLTSQQSLKLNVPTIGGGQTFTRGLPRLFPI